MKIFVLGSRGMAGHTICSYFKNHTTHIAYGIARNNSDFSVDIENDLEYLEHLINEYEPDVIINCIGLLIKDCNDRPDRAIYINSFFPHWLENLTKNTETKIIHLSTDCVFDGIKGNYTEQDIHTETNWYGRTKSMGELNNKNLTIRTSIIGTELKVKGNGLLEWALRQEFSVNGYINHLWSGITTLELAKFIEYVINNKIELDKTYHLISPQPINKYDLLKLIYDTWNKKIEVVPDYSTNCNKILVNSRFTETNYIVSDLNTQLKELYNFKY